ncbi:hypothetical protein FNV43_RR13534 [Rhamnella rubrinervis]|uniref:Uncharacterized protein n=1 Tax=Rhamnella rubrinervis TaxID=2594499 RepID=A0A8K0H1B2_9ROSA|nr:hypothetical protein FNV43_RR13534 [Rhamnella rubrinervis]
MRRPVIRFTRSHHLPHLLLLSHYRRGPDEYSLQALDAPQGFGLELLVTFLRIRGNFKKRNSKICCYGYGSYDQRSQIDGWLKTTMVHSKGLKEMDISIKPGKDTKYRFISNNILHSNSLAVLKLGCVRSATASHVELPSEDGKVIFFPSWAANIVIEGGDVLSLLDPSLERNADVQKLTKVCRFACWCIQDDEIRRPSMAQVVQILEGDFRCEPGSSSEITSSYGQQPSEQSFLRRFIIKPEFTYMNQHPNSFLPGEEQNLFVKLSVQGQLGIDMNCQMLDQFGAAL